MRVANAGLELFLEHGYDGTTIDAIADAAGISRRTFFAYFKSKDEVILTWLSHAWQAMLHELEQVSPNEHPLTAIERVLVAHTERYETPRMRTIDRVMRASDALTARRHALDAVRERELYDTLRHVWQEPERAAVLRAAAMISVGALRLSFTTRREENNARSLSEILRDTFALTREAIREMP